MFNLCDYRFEIISIARVNDVAWDVARDMFLANVRNAGSGMYPQYAGADEVNYKELASEVPVIGTVEYRDMCENFNKKFEEEM